MPHSHPAMLDDEILLRQCVITRSRASGPGGQHRNKVETAIVIVHKPTGIKAQASERRSQAENRHMAIFRLRVNLALESRGYFDLKNVPSDLWRSRCSQNGIISVNPKHSDFPAMLAEALDVIAAMKWDMPKAATMLGCSATQLVKLLKAEARGLELLNKKRLRRGQGALK